MSTTQDVGAFWKQPLRAMARFVGHRRWLRFGLRDRFARRICNPDSVEPQRFEVEFFGYRYPGELNSFIDWNVYFYGAYERGYLSLLEDLVRAHEQPVFLDVGANVGHHSLFMAGRCAMVHAFEPNPTVRQEIHRKVRTNQLANVHVHDFGLGANSGELRFFLPSGTNQGTGSFVEGYSDNNREQTILEVRNGDEWVAQARLSRLDLIKIDVEGFERQVLAGLRDSLQRFRPAVAMEWSGTTRDSFGNSDELLSMFPLGYSVRQICYEESRALFFNSLGYRLASFDFAKPGDILLTPGPV